MIYHKFSVVIATKNRKSDLEVVLPAFLNQKYDNKEVIVVDNASKDGTREFIEQTYPEVKYLYLPDNINILAQNLGVELSSGDFIWRTDSDSHPIGEDMFEKVNSYLNQFPDTDVLSFDNQNTDGSYWWWYNLDKSKYKMSDEAGYKSDTFLGSGAVIRKKIFDNIGGYWEFGMEEKDFSSRAILAGYDMRYKPGLEVIHYASPSERNNKERWLNIAKQYLRYVWKFRGIGEAITFTILYIPLQLLQGIYWKVGLLTLLEGILTFKATILRTIRKERLKLSNEERDKISLGKSEVSKILYDYKYNLKRLLGFNKK